ncbi:hypothetical protein CDAR_182001 [Caerostris darwini]|uniref:Uncharacterized protein n=1 Tax=Caerostris darwini TaxID=1538125 RepID=A0AAV4USH1_9ARAC|nr:hypothetical protein CDAR_182001 [Caerostris darwini]
MISMPRPKGKENIVDIEVIRLVSKSRCDLAVESIKNSSKLVTSVVGQLLTVSQECSSFFRILCFLDLSNFSEASAFGMSRPSAVYIQYVTPEEKTRLLINVMLVLGPTLVQCVANF